MKHTLSRLIFPLLLATSAGTAVCKAAPPAATGTGWEQVFDDEFNGTSIDTLKWNVASPGWTMPNSLSKASASKVSVADDVLTLSATRSGSTNAFSSGSVSTYNKYNFDGGYFEARILLPKTPGSWPAFWGLYNGWPPEADIMEYPLTTNGTSGYKSDEYHTAFHYKNSAGSAASGAGKVNPSSASALNGGWHTFGMHWVSDTKVDYYFDGAKVSSFTNSAVNQMASMYLILDYAVGGWPGTPSLAQWPADFSDKTQVDWVRIWQQRPSGASEVSTWKINGGGSWTTSGNWTGLVPKYSGQQAIFPTVGNSTASAVTWSNSMTVGGITFSGAATTTPYSLNGAALQLSGDGGTANAYVEALSSSQANQTINARMELANTTEVRNNMTGGQLLVLNGQIVGDKDLILNGSGIVQFSNNNLYTGNTSIGSGQNSAIARVTRSSPFGDVGTLTIGPSGNATTARLEIQDGRTVPNAINFSGRNNGSVAIQNIGGNNTVSGLMTLGVGGSFYTVQSDAGSLALTNTGTSTVAANKVFALQGDGDGTFAGVLAGAGGLTKAGAGTWAVAGNNSYTGATTLVGGVLQLKSSERLANTSNLSLAGGTLNTGGFNETMGAVSLLQDSTLDFGNASSTVKLSGTGTFASGKTLTLANWTQNSDHLFIGTSAGLSATQLAQIKFGTGAAQQLKSGEIVPAVAVPASPTNLKATAGNAQIVLSWDAVAGAASYNIKRALVTGGPYATIQTGVTAASYTDGELTNGTTYFYVVTAVGAGGESGNSNEVSATPSTEVAPNAVSVAANDSYNANQNITLTVVAPGVLANDSDADKDALTIADSNAATSGVQPVSGPTNGTLTLNSDGSFSYQPKAGFSGADSFSYQTSDGKALSNVATVSIAVKAIAAVAQSVATDEDTSAAIVLSGSGAPNQKFSYEVVAQPAHGTLSGTAPNLTYAPAPNYNGADSFTFKVSDGTSDSDPATVSIAVKAINDAPVATSRTEAVARNTAKTIALSATDAESDKLTYSVVTQPTSGTLSGSAPNLTYTPNTGYSGTDSFTFRANDGALDSDVATISLIVGGDNAAPVAASQSVTTNEDVAQNIVLSATDSNGDALTYRVVAGPTNGTLSGSVPNLTYTPAADYNGADSFTFSANDGIVDGTIAKVSILVNAVNDAPSFVVGANQTVVENSGAQSVAKFVTDISAGASNESAQTLSFVVTNDKAALFAVAPAISADGMMTYTLARNQVGTAKISVILRDNGGTANDGKNAGAAQTFTITVTASPIQFTVALAPKNVLTRDRVTATPIIADATGVTYAYQWMVNGVNMQSGAANLFELSKPSFGNAGDVISVTVTASNARGGVGTASQKVTVANSAPFAFSGTAKASAGIETVVPFQLYRNPGAADSDGDALTYRIVSGPRGGKAEFAVNAQGQTELHYTARKDFMGVDVIRFAATDSQGAQSNVASLAVDVKIAPRARPTTQDASARTLAGLSVDVPVSGASADGTPVTFKRVGGPRNGVGEFVTLSDGKTVFRYTPSAKFLGFEEVRFVALAPDGYPSEVATIRILVRASDADPGRTVSDKAPSANKS